MASLRAWAQFALIVAVIMLDAAFEEALILGAEFMMLVRWTRDMLRYDVRCIVQEKVRLIWRQRTR